PVVVLMRGDHELNEIKLQRLLGVERVVKANEATYRSMTNSPVGFAGPIGLTTRLIADNSVRRIKDGVTGAGKTDTHLLHVVPGRDFAAQYADLRKASAGDPCPRCGQPLDYARGIEVGHTFKLGTKYSTRLKANYLDTQGKPQPLVMGCYGIGVSRVVAACIEQSHDVNGIIWPLSIAPWPVSVLALNISQADVKATAQSIYEKLGALGIEALFDDRDAPAGVKLKDADLLGIPFQIVVGERKLATRQVELRRRASKMSED